MEKQYRAFYENPTVVATQCFHKALVYNTSCPINMDISDIINSYVSDEAYVYQKNVKTFNEFYGTELVFGVDFSGVEDALSELYENGEVDYEFKDAKEFETLWNKFTL